MNIKGKYFFQVGLAIDKESGGSALALYESGDDITTPAELKAKAFLEERLLPLLKEFNAELKELEQLDQTNPVDIKKAMDLIGSEFSGGSEYTSEDLKANRTLH